MRHKSQTMLEDKQAVEKVEGEMKRIASKRLNEKLSMRKINHDSYRKWQESYESKKIHEAQQKQSDYRTVNSAVQKGETEERELAQLKRRELNTISQSNIARATDQNFYRRSNHCSDVSGPTSLFCQGNFGNDYESQNKKFQRVQLRCSTIYDKQNPMLTKRRDPKLHL